MLDAWNWIRLELRTLMLDAWCLMLDSSRTGLELRTLMLDLMLDVSCLMLGTGSKLGFDA